MAPSHKRDAAIPTYTYQALHVLRRKKQAVDTEDYDTAKAVKQDIDRLRAQAAAPIDSDRSGGQSARRKPPPSSPPTQNGSFDERPVGRSTSTAAAEAPLADGRPEPPASPGETDSTLRLGVQILDSIKPDNQGFCRTDMGEGA